MFLRLTCAKAHNQKSRTVVVSPYAFNKHSSLSHLINARIYNLAPSSRDDAQSSAISFPDGRKSCKNRRKIRATLTASSRNYRLKTEKDSALCVTIRVMVQTRNANVRSVMHDADSEGCGRGLSDDVAWI